MCRMFCIPSGGVNPSFGTLRVCCCGRKKLPFAGYSIVKELLLSGGKIPRKLSGGRDFSPGPPSAHFARGAQSPRSARSPELSILRLWVGRLQEQPVEPSARRGVGPPPSGECRRHSQTKQSGEYRARTGDLLVANQALSQLS